MTLSRWRRIATGIAAGVIVLCAAFLGAAMRDTNSGVSVAADVRPATTVIPIEDDVDADADAAAAAEAGNTGDTEGTADAGDVENAGDDESGLTNPVRVIEGDASTADAESESTDETPAAAETTDDESEAPDDADDADDADAPDDADDADAPDEADAPDATGDDGASTPTPTPTAPLTAADDELGTGGGVDDAECALDRLVIYAGARIGGVARSLRAALANAGFAADCPAPVTVLASNCPQQFAGVLGVGADYDPNRSYVAASDTVDRETMTAVMGAVGFSGNEIDILDFGFVNPDKPGEQWMAIFIPPSFDGWQDLASRAGLAPTTSGLCAASGELAG